MSRQYKFSPLITIWIVCCIALTAGMAWGVNAQPITSESQTDVCRDVRALVAEEITPYERSSGAETVPDQPTRVQFATDQYAFFHVLNIRRPDGAANTPLTLQFSDADSTGLEFALFRGMTALTDSYRPLENETTATFTLNQDGLYTLVVRRTQFANADQIGYTLTADFSAGGGTTQSANVRDDTTGALLPAGQSPELQNGVQAIALPSTTFYTHADAVTTVASRGGRAGQVRYGTNGLLVGAWVNEVDLLGGDLAVRGDANTINDEPGRIFFVQNFGYAANITDEALTMFTDANGTAVATDWQAVRGIWMLRDCVGMKLIDGRSFVAPLQPNARSATFSGSVEDFDVRVATLNAAGNAVEAAVDLSWNGIADDSEVALINGVFSAQLDGDKRIQLEETTLRFFQSGAAENEESNAPYTITLSSHNATLALDFANMAQFALNAGDTPTSVWLNLGFTDSRGQVERLQDNLLRFEALEGVIRIVEQPSGTRPGAQSLWLDEADGFIEIMTPAGLPTFESDKFPGQSGYFARALNNLGGECYPVNTLLTEASCPPNGHINPANGNLWYAVTDLVAYGGLLDLALTRSYNSLAVNADGPFGRGWSTAFALDYSASYNPETASRRIEQDEAYRVGLDLTWMPRGIVTFTTPSGSRHTFTSSAEIGGSPLGYEGGELRAITMPGWTLQREDVRGQWTLRQSDGLVYRFDRAGRLLSYGYEHTLSQITVTFNHRDPDGLGKTGANTATITDDINQRVLELYYDQNARITRAVLRDTTRSDVADACDPENNCLETHYAYDENGRLIEVTYSDGQQATYTYDDTGRLIQHDDPRAPIAQVMRYDYTAENLLLRITIHNGDQAYLWREIRDDSPPNRNERRITVIEPRGTVNGLALYVAPRDEDGPTPTPAPLRDTSVDIATTYTYPIVTDTPLREPGNGFTLASVTSPIPNTNTVDSLPTTYTWNRGLLEQINARLLDGGGRNSIQFRYGTNGQIISIGTGVLGYSTASENDRVTRARFADGTAVAYAYQTDEAGVTRLESITDRYGAQYTLDWNAAGLLKSWTRSNDGVSWRYEYNAVGLVTQLDRGGHIISYTYDGLGRLIGVDDPLLGQYRINYNSTQSPCVGLGTPSPAFTQISVSDNFGTTYTARFNARGSLISTQLEQADGEFLRCLTWEYDFLGRVTAEKAWVDAQPLTTTYSYGLAPLTAAATDAAASRVSINGTVVTVHEPSGRRQSFIYDPMNRLRQVENNLGQLTRYDYEYTDLIGNSANGVRVVQRDLSDGRVLATVAYEFDSTWQLRTVQRSETDGTAQRWELFTQNTPQRPVYSNLVSSGVGMEGLNWNIGADTRPNGVQIIPSQINLPSGAMQPNIGYGITLDALGRPLRVNMGSNAITSAAYCPTADGGRKVLVWETVAATSDGTAECERTDYAYLLHYDAHERLIESADAHGRRVFAYRRAGALWAVDVQFINKTDARESTWILEYNAAGDLVRWLDDHGVLRTYEHDSTGRLTGVTVANDPQASYVLTYDEHSGLLTRLENGQGYGTAYQYDARGLLLVEQDILTSDATTYTYDALGRMISVISPLGNTTTFRYGDANNPMRLTEIIDATGVIRRFSWDDENNALVVRDIRENTTRYRFDSLGMLWMVTDALNRSHELRYNAAGTLTTYATMTRAGSAARELRLETFVDAPGNRVRLSEPNTPDWTWELEFDESDALISVTDPGGQTLDFTYDAQGRLTRASTGEIVGENSADSINDVNGANSWTLEYLTGEQSLRYNDSLLTFDPQYHLTGIFPDDGRSTRYIYTPGRRADVNITIVEDDGSGEPTTRTAVISPGDETRPHAVTLSAPGLTAPYDNTVESQTPSGQIRTTFYNAEGLIEEIRLEACTAEDFTSCYPGSTPYYTTSVRFLYDAQGRPIRVIDPEQNIEAFTYDDLGNLVAYQSLNGRSFTYQYDALNRLSAIIGPTGIKLLVSYDDLDRVTGICRTRAESTTSFSQCRIENDIVETYTYDSLGRLTTQNFLNNVESGEITTTVGSVYTGGQLTQWGVLADVVANNGAVRPFRMTDEALSVPLAVTLDYADNSALGLLRRLAMVRPIPDLSETTTYQHPSYSFEYDDALRLTRIAVGGGSENINRSSAYSYDEYGRLTQLEYAGRTFQLDYAANHQGYAFTDMQTGEVQRFDLDERGFLAALAYGLADTAVLPQVVAQYTLDPRDPANLSVLLLSTEENADSSTDDNAAIALDMQFNRLGLADNFVGNYADLRVLTDFVSNTAGQIIRQRLDGSPESLFSSDSDGYSTVTGYDDNYRLSTIRVNAKRDGSLLYGLNFTYNEVGQRETETRSYADNTQVNITYTYTGASQLTRREVNIVRGTVRLEALPLAALLPILLNGRSRKRRRWLIGAVALVLAGAGVAILSSEAAAQRRTERYVYTYTYDLAGNLAKVSLIDDANPTNNRDCVTFAYDTANRLVHVNEGGRIFRYGYDVANKLVTANNSELVYLGGTPITAFNRAGLTMQYGRIANRPPLFLAERDRLTWLVTDGRDRILKVGTDTTTPVTLIDPLGRVVSFELPAAGEIDPCNLTTGVSPMLAHPQLAFSGMIWDAKANLYFADDGRAYFPEIARFLQRDPQGPDAFGSTYDFAQRPTVPVQRQSGSAISNGLLALADALRRTQRTAALDPQLVKESFYPAINAPTTWASPLAQPPQTQAALARLAALPTWLSQAYNLPGPQVETFTGNLSLSLDGAPGQGGLRNRFTIPSIAAVSGLGDVPFAALQDLPALLTIQTPQFAAANSYDSLAWQPRLPGLADAWDVATPVLDRAYTPAAVLDWLPSPLRAPQQSRTILNIADALADLPFQTGRDWLAKMLTQALPRLPELPPANVQEWQTRWFNQDTFGLQQSLAPRWNVPELPDVPVYGLGPSAAWLEGR